MLDHPWFVVHGGHDLAERESGEVVVVPHLVVGRDGGDIESGDVVFGLVTRGAGEGLDVGEDFPRFKSSPLFDECFSSNSPVLKFTFVFVSNLLSF